MLFDPDNPVVAALTGTTFGIALGIVVGVVLGFAGRRSPREDLSFLEKPGETIAGLSLVLNVVQAFPRATWVPYTFQCSDVSFTCSSSGGSMIIPGQGWGWFVKQTLVSIVLDVVVGLVAVQVGRGLAALSTATPAVDTLAPAPGARPNPATPIVGQAPARTAPRRALAGQKTAGFTRVRVLPSGRVAHLVDPAGRLACTSAVRETEPAPDALQVCAVCRRQLPVEG